MNNITFNQLQFRLFAFLFVLFTSAIFSYRYFIELPKLEHSISALSERELDTASLSISNMLEGLSRVNYDYAVWTSTYDFMRIQDQQYIEENMVDNTFISLELDGVFFIDEHSKVILAKGFHHSKLTDLTFSFYDFEKYPNNLNMLPDSITSIGAPTKHGFINTQHGPAMFSTTQIRDSNLGGNDRGYIIMIQLLEEAFIKEVSKFTLTDVTYVPIATEIDLSKLPNWDNKSYDVRVSPYSDVVIRDISDIAITALRVQHRIGTMPSLVNEQSSIFIILMTVFIFFVYYLVLNTIIIPVKKLAQDIKDRDNKENNKEKYAPLDERYRVSELSVVSKNMNQLMATIQQQKNILVEQANTDQLTQILNRHGLMSEFERHKDLCIRQNIGFTLLMIDIDHFKTYNDSLGHLQGDIALQTIASILNDQCKRVGDACARFGGEEFTLLFSEMSNDNLDMKLNSIMQAVRDAAIPHPSSATAGFITISMGGVIVEGSDVVDFTLPKNEMFKVADSALYEAKDKGRNCFVIKNLSSEA